MHDFVWLSEAARLCAKNERTLRRAIKSGRIVGLRIEGDRRWMVSRESLFGWIKSSSCHRRYQMAPPAVSPNPAATAELAA